MMEIRRYLVLPEGGAEVMGLWAVHTHVFTVFEHTPRLHLTPIKSQCGKSVALKVLKPLCACAYKVENLSRAVLYRIIEARRPTLMIDEADGILSDERPQLISMLNSGFEQGGKVLRCKGDDHEP